MGLDIYVRWGSINDDGDTVDFPEDVANNQYTGMDNAPECGYMRHNWSSVRFCREFAQQYGFPSPILGLYPAYGGDNGDSLLLTSGELERLFEFRSQVLLWLRSRPYQKRNEIVESLPMEQRKKFEDEFGYFYQCLRNVVSFINFIELNRDKYGLRIDFH
jgi:hypothetical protein